MTKQPMNPLNNLKRQTIFISNIKLHIIRQTDDNGYDIRLL